ncbi:MAG: alpha/beta hydrolase [Spirulinaceae cyanobacterium]
MTSSTSFYDWLGFSCAYEIHKPTVVNHNKPALLLLHPIGVGLSRLFWQRFGDAWLKTGLGNALYNPDLLGCGDSAMPYFAYYPEDWAEQLGYFVQTVVKTPVILVCQGALLPVGIALVEKRPELIKGLIFSGPPAWRLISEDKQSLQQRLAWNLFASPFGNAFYRYARRRQFLQSFSIRQLFAASEAVDEEWLNTLKEGSQNLASRHAVFSFLSGFWRQDYSQSIAQINQPTLVVMGKQASSISREGFTETPAQRLEAYLKHFPNSEGKQISGRNVLPYESTLEFAKVVSQFVELIN